MQEIQTTAAELARATTALVLGDYATAGRLIARAGDRIQLAGATVLVLEMVTETSGLCPCREAEPTGPQGDPIGDLPVLGSGEARQA